MSPDSEAEGWARLGGEPRNLLTVWADLLVDALARGGVREVVASPGSRSTPFLLAAARHPALRVRAVVDERAAAFFALGTVRATGRPACLLCTSGTAPAHYFPAVIEASEAGWPLVVVSADRPTELMGCGAPQTTDQTRLFGAHARASVDLGDPVASPRALRALVQRVVDAVARSCGPSPGPVQLNARARKPLEPSFARDAAERRLEAFADALRARATAGEVSSTSPLTAREDGGATPYPTEGAAARVASRGGSSARGAAARVASRGGASTDGFAEPALVPAGRAIERALAPVVAALGEARRPALVAGPLGIDAPREALLRFAASRGLALFAEATSQLRLGPAPAELLRADAFDLWIGAPDAPAPDVVIEVGATPTSSAWARWLARQGPARRFVLGGTRFRDAAGTAEAVVLGELSALLDTLAHRLPARAADPAWRAAIERAEARAWAAIEASLGSREAAAAPPGASPLDDRVARPGRSHAAPKPAALSEGAVMRAVVEALPEGALLALGNSLPVRHADRFVRGARGPRVGVLSQRGVNGIDGWIAGAAGAASASARPTVAVIGDVAFAHDVGALAVAAEVRTPLVLVVLDNRGGRIFERLPLATSGLDAQTFALFTTPPRLDLRAAAAAFGVPIEAPDGLGALRRALGAALARPGPTVVHAAVPPGGAAAAEAAIARAWRSG